MLFIFHEFFNCCFHIWQLVIDIYYVPMSV